MIELIGTDLFDLANVFDVICITTNGFVKNNGSAVMGRGCAYTASQKWPTVPITLGKKLSTGLNVPYYLGNIVAGEFISQIPQTLSGKLTEIWSFPVKHNWWEKADLNLIKQSAILMVEEANHRYSWKNIAIPRPGCGNGQLSWSDVRPVIDDILDDRFVLVHND